MKKLLIFIFSFMFIGLVYAEDPDCSNITDPVLQSDCLNSGPGLIDFTNSYAIGEGEEIKLTPSIINGNDTMTINYAIVSGEECITLTSDGKVTGKKVSGSCNATVRTSIIGTDANLNHHDYRINVVEVMKLNSNQGEFDCKSVLNVSGSSGTLPYDIKDNVLTIRDDYTYFSISDFMVDVLPDDDDMTPENYYCEIKKEGSYFAGWYTKATGGELVSDKKEIDKIDVVYAHWSSTPIPLEKIVVVGSRSKYPYIAAIPLKHRPLGSNDEVVDFTYKLSVLYTPYYASNKNVTWSSMDESILNVDNNGLVKPKKAGRTSVKALSEDGNKEAKFDFIVENTDRDVAYTLFEPSDDEVTINVGDTLTFECYSIGTMVPNGFCTHISSDPSIATFNKDGGQNIANIKNELYALKPGKVTVTSKLDGTHEVVVNIIDDASHEAEPFNDIKISFGSNDVDNVMDDIEIDLDKLNEEGIKLPVSKLKKDGFDFAGWKVFKVSVTGEKTVVKRNGKDLIVVNGGTLKNIDIVAGESIYLEAQWIKNPKTGVTIPIFTVVILLIGGIVLYKNKYKFYNNVFNK